MKSQNSSEEKSLSFLVFLIYVIVLAPLTLILLINQLFAPLAPTLSFVELDKH